MAAKDEVRALVRREQNCCAFLRFQLIEGKQTVQLTITVPSDASTVADEILGYFEPTPSPRLGHNLNRSEGQKT